MAFRFDFSRLSGWGDRLGFSGSRPPFEGAYIYALLFVAGWFVADFGTTYIRGDMLPVGGIASSKPLGGRSLRQDTQASLFSAIKERNIFNSDHFIPDSLGEQKIEVEGVEDNRPVLTSLPLELVGTIIHGRRELSVATIQIRGKDIHAVMEEEDLEGMIKVREIERFKVIFRNLSNRKLEYVEIKEENKIQMGMAEPKLQPQEQTQFTFRREDINKHLENLPKILQDAKAVPYIEPGSGGEVGGFKMVAIKPGSIYEELGLKRGDILRSVNGEPIDNVQKAMELYQALKSSASEIELEVSRDGKQTTLNYTLE
jgi:general secretion pathway protein C